MMRLEYSKEYTLSCIITAPYFLRVKGVYLLQMRTFNVFILQTRKTASWLCDKMSRDGHAVALLSGELTVEQRIAVLDRFREGKEKVLITTNVLARGKEK